jgi:hypothetical protein
MVVVGIVLTYLVAVQVAKRAFYLRWHRPLAVRAPVKL